MDGDVELLKRIYDRFNARDIDGVLTVLTDDVACPSFPNRFRCFIAFGRLQV
jgi:hypothetical protein